jgi:hypothetical protein
MLQQPMEPTMSSPTSQLYIVVCGRIEPYSVERNLPDMTWGETIKDIARGEFTNLRRVIEVGTGLDVTEKAVRAAMDLVDEPTYQFAQLVELVLGTRVARPFFQRAA